jgi:hypothetical protein
VTEATLSDKSGGDGKRPLHRSVPRSALALLPAAILLRAFAFAAPDLVERFYSRGLYPPIARGIAAITGRLPFSVAEAAVAGLLSLLIWLGWRVLRHSEWRGRTPRLLWSAAIFGWVAAGALLLAFDLSWGLNYARPTLAERLDLPTQLPGAAEVRDLAMRSSLAATRLHAALGQEPGLPTELPSSLGRLNGLVDAAYGELALPGDRFGDEAAPAKPLAISPLMSRLGISGIYIPFTAEPSINGDVPAVTLPLVLAHEKAHHRGITDEGEANLAAVMACLRSDDPYLRYAAHLEVAVRMIGALGRGDTEGAAAAVDALGTGPRADLEAIREFWDRYRGVATRVARSMNDAYLRSNRVPDGVQSYGRVVDLLVALDRAGQLEIDADD